LNSTDLVGQVEVCLAPLLPAHSSILVGLSGGVDSVVLLHLLHQLAPRFSWQLSALHVHHGISPNADAWADFCTGLCAGYTIPLHVERVDIAPLRAHGIEAAARKLRHAAFARQALRPGSGQACDFVALAHHADDQAETLLLQLLRGSGVKGAAAMPVLSRGKGPLFAVRPEPVEGQRIAGSERASTGSARTESKNACTGSIVRPLLHCSRREILDYAAAQGLRWIEDESNADDSYPRNFLRHRALPLLEQKFPACRDTLARSAQHFAEASELLDDLARLDAQLSPSPSMWEGWGEGALEVSRLQSLSPSRAKNLLRYFLHSLGAPMPQAAQLDDMLRQLCDARQDAAVCVAYDDYEVRRYQGRVYVLHAMGEFDRNLVLPWQGEAGLDWPALNARLVFIRETGEGMSLEKLAAAPVTIRLRSGSETLRPHPDAATRTLKNLLQEHHIPPWQRGRLPLLYCGEELVCVPGVAIAAEYQAVKDEEGISLGLSR
jgi:tRNA(Ile)-lysidine synthase